MIQCCTSEHLNKIYLEGTNCESQQDQIVKAYNQMYFQFCRWKIQITEEQVWNPATLPSQLRSQMICMTQYTFGTLYPTDMKKIFQNSTVFCFIVRFLLLSYYKLVYYLIWYWKLTGNLSKYSIQSQISSSQYQKYYEYEFKATKIKIFSTQQKIWYHLSIVTESVNMEKLSKV